MDLEADDNLTKEFSEALKDALDRVGFPPAPERVAKLMTLLGLSKPQVYRITTGKAAPTIASLVLLRSLISIDDILDRLEKAPRPNKRVEGRIELSGVVIPCTLALSPVTDGQILVAVENTDKIWDVVSVKAGSQVPTGAMSVNDIRFLNLKPQIAIVDDHEATLTVLCKQLEPYFDTIGFDKGTTLLETDMSRFDGFILDWRLPDISGDDLVTEIKQVSSAPIFVITGEKSHRHEIAKLISGTDVHYLVKPIDEVILAAQMSQAISLRSKTSDV